MKCLVALCAKVVVVGVVGEGGEVDRDGEGGWWCYSWGGGGVEGAFRV